MTDAQRMLMPVAPGVSPVLQPGAKQSVEDILASIIEIGSSSVKQLEEELVGAKTAKRNAARDFDVCYCCHFFTVAVCACMCDD